MRKVVIHRPGGYERLCVEQLPELSVSPGEILVDVEAIGVNYADCVTRMGLYASARHYIGFPITPGFEVAGRVAAVGHGVTDLQPGAEVIAVTRFNGYASQVAVKRNQVFPRPKSLSAQQAAGFPAVFLTAWFALFELAHPRPADRLLVHSAAGGVGGALVQLGKIAGCAVAGVVGAPHKVAAVRAMGADAVIDKSSQRLWEAAERFAPGGYDVILDANGVSTLAQSYRHLAPVGKLVVYGFHSMLRTTGGRPSRLGLLWNYWRTPRFSPFSLTTRNHSVLGFNLSFLFDRSDLLDAAMAQLLQWLRDGRIRPAAVKAYPLERVAEAHRDLESGQTVGKLVLIP
ncbi:MAG: medium chain dehydrogenase/reductase family protein [Gammaproteobacteria bacterium]|jgi:NADPH:quinone reductase-like Zn-dependent oxidoreductase